MVWGAGGVGGRGILGVMVTSGDTVGGGSADGEGKGARGDWKCVGCGEEVPGEFEVCWNCGTDEKGQADPEFVPVQAVVREKRCWECGYSLEGLEGQKEQRCPECGAGYDAGEFKVKRKGTEYGEG